MTVEARNQNVSKKQYVSLIECQSINTDIKADLKILKHALVGEDLRGGMVKDIGDLKSKVDSLTSNRLTDNNSRKQEAANAFIKSDLHLKWKIALFTSMLASITAVVIEVIRVTR